MDLQAPSVLAQLPRPLHASTGRTQIGEVFSLTEAKKRKRYEVVAAVDGEAVNIYNVQTPKLVTSYAVPPQSSFSCQPCSIRRKRPGESGVKRQTYAAIQRPKQHVKCFIEESAGNGSTAPVISSSSYALDDSSSPIVYLGIVGNGPHKDRANDPFDVLAIHKDGCVRRLASDLHGKRWAMRHAELAKISTTYEVNSCFIVDFDEAAKSLLKRRQDLVTLALADSGGLGPEGLSVLLMVSHPTGTESISLKDVKLHLFSIPAVTRSDGIILGDDQRMKLLLNVNLAELKLQQAFDSRSVRWNFHSGSAGLHLSFDRGFINLDLSQYAPTITSQFILDDESFSSVMRISPHTVIGAGRSVVALYDTEHQSVQRSLQLDEMTRGNSTSPDDSKNLIAFISYYPKLGIAVASKGNTLVAFDLSTLHDSTSSSLKRSRDGLLIDAIGRGVGGRGSKDSNKGPSENLQLLGFPSHEEAAKWDLLRTKLADATKSRDSEGFDEALVSFFSSTTGPQSLPAQGQYVHPEIISCVLSKIFHLSPGDATSPHNLSIALWPEKTCTWLVDSGYLSIDNVDIALRRTAKPRILPPLPQGSYIQALVTTDPSLKRLNQVLHGPGPIGAGELAHSLKVTLNLARSRYMHPEDGSRAITNDAAGDTASSKIAPSPEPSLTNIFTALNVSLHRLHQYAVATIIRSIRSALSRTEIVSMIHHLRICLATGGYTSRFMENPPTPISPDHVTRSLPLDTITDLMTACVDAIGPVGWISAAGYTGAAGNVDAREFDLINDLKSEISAALSGVEEATYLKGILREFLRYGEDVAVSAQKAAGQKHKKKITSHQTNGTGESLSPTTITTTTATENAAQVIPSSSLVRYEKLNGADLIVFGGGDDDTAFGGEASGKLLPLSLKAPSTDVSRTKIKRSTGEVKTRSSREIGYLRRKAAGKYSFERLMV